VIILAHFAAAYCSPYCARPSRAGSCCEQGGRTYTRLVGGLLIYKSSRHPLVELTK
jgi:hypothetical protein